MKNILFAAAVAIATSLFAIGSTQDPHVQSPPHAMKNGTTMDCLMKMADVDLSIEDTSDGIRMTFTTKTGDVAKIRSRVEAFSKMHGASATKDMHGEMMAFSSTYEAVPGGARLTLIPRDPEQLEAFRSKVREHATAAKDGRCPMMEGMMPGMNGGMKNAPNSPHAEHDTHHAPEEK